LSETDLGRRKLAEEETNKDLRKPIQQLICDVHEEALDGGRPVEHNLLHATKRMVSMMGRVALAHERSSTRLVRLTWVLVALTVAIVSLTVVMLVNMNTDSALTAEEAIDWSGWRVMAFFLGGAFVAALVLVSLLLFRSHIDHGFLGLIFLLVLVVFLVAFSFLVAAASPGVSMKVTIVVVDGVLGIGTKLLSDRFLTYLESDDDEDAHE